MQHHSFSPVESSEDEFSSYVTLTHVQDEVGIARGTLKKYLAILGIEPVCFHIGTRCLYISRDDMQQVKHLKRNPTLLASLRLPATSSPEADETSNPGK